MQRAVMDELTALSERLVVMSDARRDAAARGARRAARQDRSHPARHPARCPRAAAARTGSASRASAVILTFGLLSPDKGIEYVIDALPAILARHPDTVYIVLGATHPHVKERHGETYRLMLESARAAARRRREHHLPQPLRQPERARRVPRRRPTSTSRRTSSRSRSRRARSRTPSARARRSISTPYWYAQRAPRRRSRRPRAVARPAGDRARGRSTCSATTRSARRDARARRRLRREHALARGRARATSQSFERARAEHAAAPAHARSRRKTLGEPPGRAARARTSSTCALHDRRHRHPAARRLQRPALRRRLLPRRQRARAARSWRSSRTPAPRTGASCARSRRATSRSCSHAFNPTSAAASATSCRTRDAGLEECGSEDSHGRALWALGTVVGRSRDPGRQSLGGQLFHAALPAVAGVHEPARVGLRAARHRRVPARVPGRQRRRRRCDRRSPSGCSTLFTRASTRRLAVVRGSRHLLQRAPVAGAARVAASRMRARGDDGGRACDRSSGSSRCSARDDGYFAPIGSNGFYVRGERKAAFDQQPVEACAMVSACLEALPRHRRCRAGRDHARRAFDWFLGQNQLQQPLYDADDRRLPRRAPRRSRQREPGRGVDARRSCSRCSEMRAADRVDATTSADTEVARS